LKIKNNNREIKKNKRTDPSLIMTVTNGEQTIFTSLSFCDIYFLLFMANIERNFVCNFMYMILSEICNQKNNAYNKILQALFKAKLIYKFVFIVSFAA
jgi:hypothetical protein